MAGVNPSKVGPELPSPGNESSSRENNPSLESSSGLCLASRLVPKSLNGDNDGDLSDEGRGRMGSSDISSLKDFDRVDVYLLGEMSSNIRCVRFFFSSCSSNSNGSGSLNSYTSSACLSTEGGSEGALACAGVSVASLSVSCLTPSSGSCLTVCNPLSSDLISLRS